MVVSAGCCYGDRVCGGDQGRTINYFFSRITVLSEQKTGLCLTLWSLFKLYFSLHGFFFSKDKGTLLRLSSITAYKNQNK